jgi:hypothetical protein
LTLFMQDILHYSALKAGFAFLPVISGVIVSAQIASNRLLKVGPKPSMVVGAFLALSGLVWLSQINAGSGYVDGLLGPMVVFALGMGFLFVPLTVLAVVGVEPHESRSASGLLNVMQQVGSTIGLAILTTAFATASNHESAKQLPLFMAKADDSAKALYEETHQLPAAYGSHVFAHGVSAALHVAVVLGVLALIAALVGINAKTSDLGDPVANVKLRSDTPRKASRRPRSRLTLRGTAGRRSPLPDLLAYWDWPGLMPSGQGADLLNDSLKLGGDRRMIRIDLENARAGLSASDERGRL